MEDRIPDTPLFDRSRQRRGYRLNKMAMGLVDPANRDAFRADEEAYLDRFGLSAEEKQAVRTRNWQEMVRLGGNVFYILKISAISPARPSRPMGMLPHMAARATGSAMTPATIGVSVGPGPTALMRIPSGAHSSASDRTMPFKPALDAA